MEPWSFSSLGFGKIECLFFRLHVPGPVFPDRRHGTGPSWRGRVLFASFDDVVSCVVVAGCLASCLASVSCPRPHQSYQLMPPLQHSLAVVRCCTGTWSGCAGPRCSVGMLPPHYVHRSPTPSFSLAQPMKRKVKLADMCLGLLLQHQ